MFSKQFRMVFSNESYGKGESVRTVARSVRFKIDGAANDLGARHGDRPAFHASGQGVAQFPAVRLLGFLLTVASGAAPED